MSLGRLCSKQNASSLVQAEMRCQPVRVYTDLAPGIHITIRSRTLADPDLPPYEQQPPV